MVLSDALFTDENKVLLNKTQNALKGDRYKWIWYLYDDIENGTVTEANGTDYFQFTFAGDCLVEIKLHEKFEYTIVELTQKTFLQTTIQSEIFGWVATMAGVFTSLI